MYGMGPRDGSRAGDNRFGSNMVAIMNYGGIC